MTRRRTLTVTALAVLTIGATSTFDVPTKLIWNATASAPVGFYTVEPAERIEVPDLVAVMPPKPLADFMVTRGYVGRGVPLLKRVLGLPGQRVCRSRSTITVDGVEMGEAGPRHVVTEAGKREADLVVVAAGSWSRPLAAGLGAWTFGAPGSVHVGMSGVIFAYFGFLLGRGIYERRPGAIVLSLLVGWFFGSMLWGVLPFVVGPGISWQSHLFGFLGGALTARALGRGRRGR